MKKNLIQLFLVCAITSPAFTTPAQTVTVTAATGGDYHSLLIKSDGTLWAMGFNVYGALGDGTYNQTNKPEMITNNVHAISARNYSSMFVKNDGTLWAMGQNNNGEFGNVGNTNKPTMITNGVTAVALGIGDVLFLKNDGSLWGMGGNFYGELGDGTSNSTNSPEMITSNVTAIANGEFHSLFIRTDGTLWGMGQNTYGQLGLGTLSNTNKPTFIASNVTAISCGQLSSYFIKSDGSLWAMGDDEYGELGDGKYVTSSPYGTNQPELIISNNVAAVSAGDEHCVILKTDGSLWVVGWNYYGQLGDGTSNETNSFEMITNNVAAMGAGGYHTLFIKTDGSLWGMGQDYSGELGDGTSGTYGIYRPELIVSPPPTYKIVAQILSVTNVQLTFSGIAGTNYALDRSTNLVPAIWVPQKTNAANSGGTVIFTNTPNPNTNNFWRVRSVP